MVDIPKNVIGLFDDLIGKGEQIKDECKKMYFAGAKKAIDAQAFEAWRTSCLTLLRSTFGTSSPHYDSFVNLKFFDHYNSTLLYLGILQGARDDIRKGYFYHKDLMLSVNIFNSFLSRALLFAERGESQKALGVLETVVCEALRKLAETRGTSLDQTCGMLRAADTLLKAGAIPESARESIAELQAFLAAGPEAEREGGGFSAWHAWAQKFLYEHLGSKIVIVN
jgi:hypothetical protein